MERDDIIEYSLDAHHSEEAGRQIRRKIWLVTLFLAVVTAVEVGLGAYWRSFLSEDKWQMVKWSFIVLTLVKATYIVMTFMHLGDERRNIRVAKWFTAFWGVFAIGFALFAGFAENLIEAINILGSIFYGVVLGLFLVAFFLRKIGGSAVFWGACAAQLLVFALYFTLSISYLWYNLIGCAACMIISAILQTFLPRISRIDADAQTP